MERLRLSYWAPLAAVFLVALALAGCDQYSLPAASVSGTVYIDPADLSGFTGTKTGVVVLDADTDALNGGVLSATITIIDGSSSNIGAVSYSISNVPPGTYYLYAYFDLNGNGLEIDNGDPVGYYGRPGFNGTPTTAQAVQIVIPASGWLNFDLWLSSYVS